MSTTAAKTVKRSETPRPLRSADAIGLCIRALEAGLVLWAHDSTDGTTYTAGRSMRANGVEAWEIHSYRRGAQVTDDAFFSAPGLAREFVSTYVGKWRGEAAALRAFARAA